ncbi:hypothetical protein [Aquimarina litoralis]|uniref:hypothetical protein n=1 Tax=Aquimarina litoralis TaxID=584605 RepID=UPI001C568074|nr:hypothetical protein [Aquimarina litoralis]MBW1298200.1 hypothetical protein [Aquimarina litoralis]
MKKIKKIYLILISIFFGCNFSSHNRLTNSITIEQFNDQISLFFSRMETREDFNKEELTILLKQYNTIQTLENQNNKIYQNYTKSFRNNYMKKVISEFEFKISKGMGLYSRKLDMYILPSSRISENDTYTIKN